MTPSERREFLTTPVRTATLATVRPDGRPHATPVWIALDDDDTVVFTTGTTSVKGKNILADPRVSLCIDDDRPPFAFVVIEGTAAVSTDPGDMISWATRIGGRYMGADRAVEYGRRNGGSGELLIRVTPTRITAMRNVAD